MDLLKLEEYLITTPLSHQQRQEYLKVFLNNAYLKGIDRGTSLEISKLHKLKQLHDARINKKFKKLLDDIYDLIQIEENRVYREKYKGRYNYYKKKPKEKIKITTKFKPAALW